MAALAVWREKASELGDQLARLLLGDEVAAVERPAAHVLGHLPPVGEAIEECRDFQQTRPENNERRRAIARWRILELLREQLVMQALNGNGAVEKLDRLAAEVAAKQRDPYSAVEELIK